MVLTQAAALMLGDGATQVRIGFNPKAGAIGLKSAVKGPRGSYRLRERRNSVSRLVDGKRVFAHHGLIVDKARSFDAQDFGDEWSGSCWRTPRSRHRPRLLPRRRPRPARSEAMPRFNQLEGGPSGPTAGQPIRSQG